MNRLPRSIPVEANTRNRFLTSVTCSTVKRRTCGRLKRAILTVGFKLDEYARFVTKADLPEGFAVVITDHVGGI